MTVPYLRALVPEEKLGEGTLFASPYVSMSPLSIK